MFAALFNTSTVDPKAPNLHPVSGFEPKTSASDLFGDLRSSDLEWTCAGGFVTETQTFYHFLEDDTILMCQVIHSSIGLWYPTIQFTCKIYNPNTMETIWRSINVTNFVTPPPGLDKRSCKADQFSITSRPSADPSLPESYVIRANLSDDLQVSFDVARPASVPGFKVGQGPKGGFSYFGPDVNKAEGYVVHRFWPHTRASGHLIYKGQATSIQGIGMFVHAIQGMRPNLMEFTTLESHGRYGAGSGGVTVNVGSLVLGGKLAVVTAETKWPDEVPEESAPVISRVTHVEPVHDPDTGYRKPSALDFRWAGPSILSVPQGTISASLYVDVGNVAVPKGLIEKVDVLAEIPYVIKTMVNYVAGTKPYIYQWQNKAKLVVRGQDNVIPGLSDGLEIEGLFFCEASFIS
ncbi:oxidative stress survival, Svf1-like protein [Boletus reticuloceps]|uniref:Oxidative stress survival, Svf1-like protein n=1 Tax=Boletus reticuloceps TaxID=495285 RepID=A0A8I2YJH8_9AGAM|nr:oxidative stress survival, Svf1-like protein [Boletus reticuloceps]